MPLILPLTVNIFGVKQVKRYKGSFSLEKVTYTHIPTHNRCISDKICSVGSKQGQSYLHIGNLTKFKVYLKKKIKNIFNRDLSLLCYSTRKKCNEIPTNF